MYINAYTKFYQNSSICSDNIEEKYIFASIKGNNSVVYKEFSLFAIPNHSSLISMSMQTLKKIGQKLLKLRVRKQSADGWTRMDRPTDQQYGVKGLKG